MKGGGGKLGSMFYWEDGWPLKVKPKYQTWDICGLNPSRFGRHFLGQTTVRFSYCSSFVHFWFIDQHRKICLAVLAANSTQLIKLRHVRRCSRTRSVVVEEKHDFLHVPWSPWGLNTWFGTQASALSLSERCSGDGVPTDQPSSALQECWRDKREVKWGVECLGRFQMIGMCL